MEIVQEFLTRFVLWEVSVDCESTLHWAIGHDLCHNFLYTMYTVGRTSWKRKPTYTNLLAPKHLNIFRSIGN